MCLIVLCELSRSLGSTLYVFTLRSSHCVFQTFGTLLYWQLLSILSYGALWLSHLTVTVSLCAYVMKPQMCCVHNGSDTQSECSRSSGAPVQRQPTREPISCLSGSSCNLSALCCNSMMKIYTLFEVIYARWYLLTNDIHRGQKVHPSPEVNHWMRANSHLTSPSPHATLPWQSWDMQLCV